MSTETELNTTVNASSFSRTVNGKLEIVAPKFNDHNPLVVTIDGKERKVFTANQAIDIIGLTGENARNQLQQMIQKMTVLKVGEACKQGTLQIVSLLDADTVLKKAAKYTARGATGNGSTEPIHEIRISPEFLIKFVNTEPADMSEDDVIKMQIILGNAENVTKERTEYHRARNAKKAAEKFNGK